MSFIQLSSRKTEYRTWSNWTQSIYAFFLGQHSKTFTTFSITDNYRNVVEDPAKLLLVLIRTMFYSVIYGSSAHNNLFINILLYWCNRQTKWGATGSTLQCQLCSSPPELIRRSWSLSLSSSLLLNSTGEIVGRIEVRESVRSVRHFEAYRSVKN